MKTIQSGLEKHFSTTVALMKFTSDIFSNFDINMCPGTILLDLIKAVDLVDHYLLLDKLFAVGLTNTSLL